MPLRGWSGAAVSTELLSEDQTAMNLNNALLLIIVQMTFSELILARQSVRRYSPASVETGKIMQCLDAARLAPSASNSQPWSFIVVDDATLRTEVARATFTDIQLINKFSVQAPAFVVIVREKARLITRLA